MIIYAGPVILGFILGFILGSRIRDNPNSEMKFTKSVYLVFIIVAFIAAYFFGPYPYYTDVPLASGFVSGAVGVIVGRLVFRNATFPTEPEED